MSSVLTAGAAAVDITPEDSQFLFGYPHVSRYSTGVYDPLLSSALYLDDGRCPLLFVANDVIYVCRDSVRRVRARIFRETGIPAERIMVTATHTHSGPLTVDTLNNGADPTVPKTDPRYVERLEDGIVRAAVNAFRNAQPAEIALAVADGSCVGTNRHDPKGPANPETPVLVVRNRESKSYIAVMIVCSMHPTVLHEDSTLYSADFPGMTRQYLQEHLLGKECTVVYHTGPSGNQSPRHVTKANTFDEAARLGGLLGQAILNALNTACYSDSMKLSAARAEVTFPRRTIPTAEQAEEHYRNSTERLENLRRADADPREARTAECDWFGAEETLALARAVAEGRHEAAIDSVLPAEILLMRIGPWFFAGWPGESFVEFAISVRKQYPQCHIITLANGELQGYLVTAEAVKNKWYEAMTSLFASPASGMILVEKTLELLGGST
jgi:hypothetical protein